VVTSRSQAKDAEPQVSRWLADRARPFADAPLQKRSTRQFISLSQGTPDLPTPRHAIDAVQDYLRDGTVYYTFHDGMPELREAIARKLDRENGLHYDPESEIIVTAGAQEGMFVALFSTLNPGDEVIAADPHYRVYDEVIAMCGATVNIVPTIEETGFQIDTDALEAAITPRTRAILIVSPDNPTGSVQNRQTSERIAAIAREHDLLVYSDELYERFIFDGAEHVSLAALPEMHERTITINGFSKAYAMTGWRVGYLGVPAALKPAMTTIKHATSICAAAPSQIAALAILEGPQEPLQQMMAEWTERRSYLYDRLDAMGARPIRTPGAYYVFFDVSPSGMTATEFATAFAEAEQVRVGSGAVFGPGGAPYARASFMLPMPELKVALDRLERFWTQVTVQAAPA
jgi:aminotransferase